MIQLMCLPKIARLGQQLGIETITRARSIGWGVALARQGGADPVPALSQKTGHVPALSQRGADPTRRAHPMIGTDQIIIGAPPSQGHGVALLHRGVTIGERWVGYV